MVEWSDAERSAILGLWGKLNPDELGPLALARYHCITFFTDTFYKDSLPVRVFQLRSLFNAVLYYSV